MSIDLICKNCGKTLRVADKYAGRRASCPACHAPVDIPEIEVTDELEELEPIEPADEPALSVGGGTWDDLPEQEELPDLDELDDLTREVDSEGGYRLGDNPLDALSPPDSGGESLVTVSEQMAAAGLAEPTPTKVKHRDAKPLPGHQASQHLIDRDKNRRASARRSLMVKVALLLVVAGGLFGVVYWYANTLGKSVFVVTAEHVSATRVLNEVSKPEQSNGLHHHLTKNPLLGMGGSGGPASQMLQGGATDELTEMFRIGGREHVYALGPSGQGDHVLVVLDIREGLLLKRNQWSGYNVRFNESQFEAVSSTGQSLGLTMLRSPVDEGVSMLLSRGSRIESAMPLGIEPSQAVYDERVRHNQGAGTLVFDGRDGVKGEVTFERMTALYPNQNISGVRMQGELIHRLPGGGEIAYDYRGASAHVEWSEGMQGWWAKQDYMLGSVTTLELHRCALLIERPSGDDRIMLRLGGEDLVTIRPRPSDSWTASSTSSQVSNASSSRDVSAASSSSGEVGVAVPSDAAPNQSQTGASQATAVASANSGATGTSNASGSAGSGNVAGSNPNPLGYFSALAQARNKAKGVVAASNLKQIGMAMEAYRTQHGGAFPEDFAELELFMPGLEALLVNPRTGESDGFIYEPPGQGDDLAQTVIVWEARGGYKDLSGRVLYGDGHVSEP